MTYMLHNKIYDNINIYINICDIYMRYICEIYMRYIYIYEIYMYMNMYMYVYVYIHIHIQGLMMLLGLKWN